MNREPQTENERAYFGVRYLLAREIVALRAAFDVGCTADELKKTITPELMCGTSQRFHGGKMITPERLAAELHKAIEFMAENPDTGKVKNARAGEPYDVDRPGSWDFSDTEPFCRSRTEATAS